MKHKDALSSHGIVVVNEMIGDPDSKEPWLRKTWLVCSTPHEQYDRTVSPGTYIDSFDGDVEAFVGRYRLRFS